MTNDVALQRLLDRQSIIDCLHRYTRGLDRGDYELALTAYHENAIDDHGYFIGKPADFVKWSAAYRSSSTALYTRHSISNHTVDFTGSDTAHVETYYLHESVAGAPPVFRLTSGRYLDRFERRSGEWRIATRVCSVEATGECAYIPLDERAGFETGRRDKSDISYMRPLISTRAVTKSDLTA
jgi:hypothetical protein